MTTKPTDFVWQRCDANPELILACYPRGQKYPDGAPQFAIDRDGLILSVLDGCDTVTFRLEPWERTYKGRMSLRKAAQMAGRALGLLWEAAS